MQNAICEISTIWAEARSSLARKLEELVGGFMALDLVDVGGIRVITRIEMECLVNFGTKHDRPFGSTGSH